jgi:transketolase
MLHICGYGLKMDDLKQFRQLHSLTPGHPEYGLTPGIDASAGPLGQGISQAVGMAMAEEAVRAQYPDGAELCDHRTFCLCGDGDLEEGISQESISFAGLQGLGKLVLIYDANGSTLDGPTSDSLAENEAQRAEASGWRTFEIEDGNDLGEISDVLTNALTPSDRPTLVVVKTKIGYGTPLEGSHKCHGSPLGAEMTAEAKKAYGYDYPPFTVPEAVYSRLEETFGERGEEAHAAYEKGLKAYKKAHKDEYAVFQKAVSRDLSGYLAKMPRELKSEASRATSGHIIAWVGQNVPFALGGAADVEGSVKTAIPGDPGFSKEHRDAHDIRFGIREFLMAGAQNGMLLHGGLLTYIGSFFVFSDYMKPAMRMSALEKLPAIYILTHDSVAVGEDGPTHEPIEQLAALRSMPGMVNIRPADAKEVYGAYMVALNRKDGPTSLILSRQTLPLLDGSSEEKVGKGAYIVYGDEDADIELLATGSEVNLAIEAAKILGAKKIKAAVVSMPSFELFERQGEEYKRSVLFAPYCKRFSIEMASTFGWGRYAKHNKGIDEFGLSAPSGQVIESFGFTPEKVAEWVASSMQERCPKGE